MFEVEATSQLILPDGRPIGVANNTSVGMGEIAADKSVQSLLTQLGGWVEKSRAGSARGGILDRQMYSSPLSPYEQMRAARHAVRNDDIVSGVADATEAIAFDGGVKWESAEPEDADIFNQLSADINLDAKLREMWRDLFTVDAFICAKIWDTVSYTVRGVTTNGNKKKRKVSIYAPTQLTILKPENIVPIGYGPLRRDDLAWQATPYEVGRYNSMISAGTLEEDPLMSVFYQGLYAPGPDESTEMSDWGVNQSRLMKLNSDWVFRHTSTRPDWAKFPDVRLRSVFALLDLKQQLMASDRATLIGAANYILLIRKGSDDKPATQEELTNLTQKYNFLAKLPVIISDHRLEIDVIAPKVDFVLRQDAYATLDARILARCLSTFVSTQTSGRSSTAADTFSDILSSTISNRRHMIKRTLEQQLARAIVEHPRNAGIFEERPSLVFTPRTVSVGVNQAELQAMLALRTQREISRDTILEYLGLDQATEAQRLETEEQVYDQIFKTQIPFSATGTTQNTTNPGTGDAKPDSAAPAGTSTPATKTATPKAAPNATPNATPEAPAVSGRRGGRPTGGGTTPQSPTKQAAPRSPSGNPRRSTP